MSDEFENYISIHYHNIKCNSLCGGKAITKNEYLIKTCLRLATSVLDGVGCSLSRVLNGEVHGDPTGTNAVKLSAPIELIRNRSESGIASEITDLIRKDVSRPKWTRFVLPDGGTGMRMGSSIRHGYKGPLEVTVIFCKDARYVADPNTAIDSAIIDIRFLGANALQGQELDSFYP